MEIGCHHAEMNVVCNAAANGVPTRGAWLFVTGEPCVLCSKLIHHAGIEKVLVIDGGYAGANGTAYLENHGVQVERVTGPKTPGHPPKPNPMKSRKETLACAKRVVIKVGSALLIDSSINLFTALAKEISALREQGRGHFGILRCHRYRQSGPQLTRASQKARQSPGSRCAGATTFNERVGNAFEAYNVNVAQVLLTHADLEARERFNNARQSIDALLKMGIVPIINENDSVATEEIQVGDNDNLAAHIAALVHAELLILLTDVDAVYDSPPSENPDAKPHLRSHRPQDHSRLCFQDRTVRYGRWWHVHQSRSR